jgi:DNA-binding GntR family transcriptional regulator
MEAVVKGNDGNSLMEQAYAQLRREIITCKLRPGSDISEAELADRLNMSKTPIREALSRLRTDGFVMAYPRRGYRIAPVTLSDMNELFDVRMILEGGVAALAATNLTEDELNELEKLADVTYDLLVEDSIEQFIMSNRRFHTAIALGSGRPRLVNLVTKNLDELERFFYIGAILRNVSPETKDGHHSIVKTLRQREPDAARDILVAHNLSTRDGLIGVIASGRDNQIGII